MKKYGLLSAVALLMFVNIIVLASVARNRAGAPEAVIELTERELEHSFYRSSADKENTGISLRLAWNQYPGYNSKFLLKNNRGLTYDWFDQSKLEATGFDCSLPLTDPKAERYYEKILPRKAFAVLEFEGKAWDAWHERARISLSEVIDNVKKGTAREKDLKEAQEEYEQEMKTRSRLFAVDVGSDPARLRQQYPDNKRYLVVPAKISLTYIRQYNSAPQKLTGYISEVLVDNIHVPKTMRSVLDALSIKNKGQMDTYYPYALRKREPSYKVTLFYGSRYEPWVGSIQPIAQ